MKKKALKPDKAKKVLEEKTPDTKKKTRSIKEVRKAMYGSDAED